MKNVKKLISLISCISMLASAVPFAVSAESNDIVYGTMDIPYSEFYQAELAGSANEDTFEVDAVSSATVTKWAKNGEGELFEGTYNEANEDGTGTILGVTYPVAISSDDLAQLGENNYNFTELSEVPDIYKTVTLENDEVYFGEVSGEVKELADAEATISTSTAWGDYLIEVSGTPEELGVIYGVILKTDINESYALRHLENIWRGQLAWSVGFTTQEPHGNVLNYEDYQNLMGQNIVEILYITDSGYWSLKQDLYAAVKFDGSVEVSDSAISDGTANITLTDVPEDYNLAYSIDGLECEISENIITFDDATPGSYTLSVTDADGIYMNLSASFELTTDITPAEFDGNAIVKKSDASDEEFANYLANITSVTVNGTTYNASGRKSVAIVNKEDGTIDTSVTSGGEAIFTEDGFYTVSVKSAGYSENIVFTLGTAPEYTVGDVNADGNVNILDLILVKGYLVESTQLSDTEIAAGDFNGDEQITSIDLISLKKFLLDME